MKIEGREPPQNEEVAEGRRPAPPVPDDPGGHERGGEPEASGEEDRRKARVARGSQPQIAEPSSGLVPGLVDEIREGGRAGLSSRPFERELGPAAAPPAGEQGHDLVAP